MLGQIREPAPADHGAHRRAVGHVVGHLRELWQTADAGVVAADNPEVERGDGEARERAELAGPFLREGGGKHERPTKGEGDMGRRGGG